MPHALTSFRCLSPLRTVAAGLSNPPLLPAPGRFISLFSATPATKDPRSCSARSYRKIGVSVLAVGPDATVLVSAPISRAGNPDRITRAWQEAELSLVVCPQLLAEVRDVLQRPRPRRFISESEANEFVDLIAAVADVRTDPEPVAGLVPADPDDDYLVALARETGVDYILSSDQHLTGLDRHGPRSLHRPNSALYLIASAPGHGDPAPLPTRPPVQVEGSPFLRRRCAQIDLWPNKCLRKSGILLRCRSPESKCPSIQGRLNHRRRS